MVDNDSAVDTERSNSEGEVTETFDWTETAPSSAVVETVAVATSTEVTELEPIQYSVDADALDRLARDVANPDRFRISFTYAGTGVVVTGTGLVRVSPSQKMPL